MKTKSWAALAWWHAPQYSFGTAEFAAASGGAVVLPEAREAAQGQVETA